MIHLYLLGGGAALVLQLSALAAAPTLTLTGVWFWDDQRILQDEAPHNEYERPQWSPTHSYPTWFLRNTKIEADIRVDITPTNANGGIYLKGIGSHGVIFQDDENELSRQILWGGTDV
jgi:hypothetical protein